MSSDDLPLLEREHELAGLDDAVAAALRDTGRLTLVEGPPGIGKSALLSAAAEIAGRAGCTVLTARGDVLETPIGYAIVRRLLHRVVFGDGPSSDPDLLAGSAAWAAPVLGLVDPGRETSDESTSMHGLYWLTANLAERAPLVMIVDDAQWADESSLRWLLYLARRLGSLPVSLVAGIRSGEPRAAVEPLGALAAEPGATVLHPAPLSPAATAALLEATYSAPVQDEFARACHTWTSGNPLLLSELARGLRSRSVPPRTEAVALIREIVPDRVRAIAAQRVAQLPAEAAELIRGLSVFGETAEQHEVAALTGLTTAAADRATDLLIAAGLIQGELPLRFTHPVIRSAVYAELDPPWRAQSHRRAAEIVFRDGGDGDRVAAHLLESLPAADPWVVEQLREAASRTLDRGSAGAAAALLARAGREPPPPDLAWQILYDLGRAQMQARDFGAVESLGAAITHATDPAQHAQAALLLGRLLLYAGRPQAAVDTLDRALALLPAQDEIALELQATVIAAARLDHELLALAEQRTARGRRWAGSGSAGARLLSGQLAYQAVISVAPAADAIALARTALADGRAITESAGRPDAYVVPISMLAICDELAEADAHFAEATAAARAGGRQLDYAIVAGMRSWTSHALGRLADAEVQAQDVLELSADSPELAAAVGGFATSTLAGVLIDRGALSAAQDVLGANRERAASSSASSARDLLFAAARLSSERGDWQRAAAELQTCGELHERARVRNPAMLPWRSERALALNRLGDREGALNLATQELALAEQFGARRPIGVALRALGLIGGGDDGLDQLERATRVLAGSAAALEQIRCAIALGAALRHADQRPRAREVLREALDRATLSGAALLAQAADRELATMGSRPRSPLLRGVDSLSAAERRVAEMAAAGMTNPQIAQALFVTRATVQSHLHATYRKLQITSREQLSPLLDRDP